jgi:hypothetical protein
VKNKKHTAQSAFFNLRAGICLALVCAVAISAEADNIIVTNTNDSGPGSLRQALADANGGDTITFAVTGTIALTSGDLVIDKNITVSGPGGICSRSQDRRLTCSASFTSCPAARLQSTA